MRSTLLIIATSLCCTFAVAQTPEQTLSKRESRCVARCDMMRYQCAQGGNDDELCTRGRDACLDRCMGRAYNEGREQQRVEQEKRRLETDTPDR